MPSDSSEDYILFDPNVEKKKSREGIGFMYVGALAGLAGLGYMIRNFKNKQSDMKLSVYVIHTRLLAQGTVVGVLSLGMIHQLYTRYADKKASAP